MKLPLNSNAMKNLIAEAKTTIDCPVDKVWDAFVNPDTIKKYMFGTNVISDWKEGSKITWKGEWKGKSYEDKGEILKMIPKKKLQYSHYSPLAGIADIPENYHIVTVDLLSSGDHTDVSLVQDKNASELEKKHSERNWAMMLTTLKQLLENEGED